MKFSIIIPVFNQEQYLWEAIESALDQTVKCEIIVINDGSTDNSLRLAKSYEPRVKVIDQVNKGLASARNTGIMNATGEYILPLDADDILLENCVETMQKFAKRGPDVIASSFKTFGVNSGEVILTNTPTLEEFKTLNRIGYFSAIKRSVLLARGGYNPKMTWGYEDWDLWIDIFKRGHSLCLIPEPLMLYRIKEQSMIQEADRHRDELINQMKKNHPDVYK